MKYKLICFDMDGVIFKDVNFWMELHKAFGTFEEGKILTEKYLNTDYQKLVDEVVKRLWKGRDAKPHYELVQSLEYNPGVTEAFVAVHNKGYKTAIISASSMDCARRVQREHYLDHVFANDLIIVDGKVSGEFGWPIAAGHHNKAQVLSGLCSLLEVDPKECIYIGDSHKDIEAFKAAGLGIAFNPADEEVKKDADIVIESNDLSKIIPYI